MYVNTYAVYVHMCNVNKSLNFTFTFFCVLSLRLALNVKRQNDMVHKRR